MTFECQKCGAPTRMQVQAGISAPAELSHKFSKANLRSKDVWLTHVNWETADYICTNTNCQHVTNGYGNYVSRMERQLAERDKQYGELVKQLEDSSNSWSVAYAELREALTSISTALDAYGVRWCREVAKEALQEKGE